MTWAPAATPAATAMPAVRPARASHNMHALELGQHRTAAPRKEHGARAVAARPMDARAPTA